MKLVHDSRMEYEENWIRTQKAAGVAHQNSICLAVLRFKQDEWEKGFEGDSCTCDLLEGNMSWWVGPSRSGVGRRTSELIWPLAEPLAQTGTCPSQPQTMWVG